MHRHGKKRGGRYVRQARRPGARRGRRRSSSARTGGRSGRGGRKHVSRLGPRWRHRSRSRREARFRGPSRAEAIGGYFASARQNRSAPFSRQGGATGGAACGAGCAAAVRNRRGRDVRPSGRRLRAPLRSNRAITQTPGNDPRTYRHHSRSADVRPGEKTARGLRYPHGSRTGRLRCAGSRKS